MKREDVRNIAIIAHVDHGKTTLVDEMLKQSGIFRDNQEVAERVMDSNDIEKERGITILSKNTGVMYNGIKINIIDTPGHADFGGEVERVLKMVNGVVLVVDAFEGPMPQTKFVLKKALELDLSVIVCVNKVDRPEARPDEVVDETLELLMELDAGDKQLDCPFVFASAKEGFATLDLDGEKKDMKPLFETIIEHIEAPEGDPEKPLQVLISTIDYNEYVGRIGIGKVDNGEIAVNKECMVVNAHDPERKEKVRITKLYEFEGLDKVDVKNAQVGSIVAISGISDLSIGDTICDVDGAEAIPFQKISEPTISMQFMVNDSPLAGQEGKYVTSRHIRDRLFRELNTDVSLRVEESENQDSYKVSGRGELHLSVLIENMRREGYEFAVSKAEVLYHYDENGKKLEPMEIAVIDVPEEFTGAVIEKLSQRKGELQNMTAANGGYARLEFSIPSRGLIGYRGEFMTDTKGNGIVNLEKHIENLKLFGVPVVVTLNQFATDTEAELTFIKNFCEERDCDFALSQVWEKGGEGGIELAKAILRTLDNKESNYKPLYTYDDTTIEEKIETIATKIYGADKVVYTAAAARQKKRLTELGYGNLPICMAKNQYSLSDDPKKLGRPEGFDITIREIYVNAGAGFLVALTGDVMTMPGLPKKPAAEGIDVNDDGVITGLF